MFGARTDYYVRLNLIECEGRPGGPGSYSHYLDFGTGSRPSYWCEAAMQNMIALASHGSSTVQHTVLYTPGMLLPRLILGSLGGGGRFRRHLLSAALDSFRWHSPFLALSCGLQLTVNINCAK